MRQYYILQIIEHNEIGTIRDVDVTKSLPKAKKWFNKKLKTDKYSHGYFTVEVSGKE